MMKTDPWPTPEVLRAFFYRIMRLKQDHIHRRYRSPHVLILGEIEYQMFRAMVKEHYETLIHDDLLVKGGDKFAGMEMKHREVPSLMMVY